MKIYVLMSAFLLAFASTTAAEEGKTEPENPIKIEMRLLNKAFLNLMDSLILNNLKAIEEPFHEVHKAKANTEKALEKGEIKLPKNNDRLKQFIEMDEQFHKKMKALIQVSGKGDMKKTQEIAHQLLNGCIKCHNMFRN